MPERFNVVTPGEAKRIFYAHLSPGTTAEWVPVGESLDPGKIIESNSLVMARLVREWRDLPIPPPLSGRIPERGRITSFVTTFG